MQMPATVSVTIIASLIPEDNYGIFIIPMSNAFAYVNLSKMVAMGISMKQFECDCDSNEGFG